MNSPEISKTEYLVLSNVDIERTGRDVGKRLRSAGCSISWGTLYTTLRRLAEKGMVNVREDRDVDGRLRHYLITGHGRRVWHHAWEYYGWLNKLGKAALE